VGVSYVSASYSTAAQGGDRGAEVPVSACPSRIAQSYCQGSGLNPCDVIIALTAEREPVSFVLMSMENGAKALRKPVVEINSTKDFVTLSRALARSGIRGSNRAILT
jgi:hypothetical protein